MTNCEERLRAFMKVSRIFVFLLLFSLIIAALVYLYMSEETYHLIMLCSIVVITVILLLSAFIIFMVISAYKRGSISKRLALTVNKFIKRVIPFAIELVSLFKMNKNVIRGFFVDINNIIVHSIAPHCRRENLLVLLPHCLQWSECEYKLTSNPYNCKRCGKCSIKKILEVTEKYGVKINIASGGTMARKAILEYRPEVIISVACSRDLVSGILDVDEVPVIAIENATPEGPCVNTKVDVEKIEEAICRVLQADNI